MVDAGVVTGWLTKMCSSGPVALSRATVATLALTIGSVCMGCGPEPREGAYCTGARTCQCHRRLLEVDFRLQSGRKATLWRIDRGLGRLDRRSGRSGGRSWD